MQRISRKIIGSTTRFFNSIIDKEAGRVFAFYNDVFVSSQDTEKGGDMRTGSNICKDLFATYLRSQISDLENMLFHIEGADKIEDAYIDESLKKVEGSIRQLRKLNVA